MIPVVFRANLNYLLRHPWQLALAILGITIGVAVIVAVDLANSSARKAFLLSMDTVTGAATHQVIGGPRGIDESDYVQLRVRNGVRNIAPVVEGFIRIGERDLSLLGVDAFAEDEMRSFTRPVTIGPENGETTARSVFADLLTRRGAVMMSHKTAAALGLDLGEQFQVVASGHRHEATLLATFEGGVGLDDLVTADIATAQEWLDSVGRLTRIDVRLAGEGEVDRKTLEALLPDGTRLLNASGRSRRTAEMSDAFMTNLTAMSLLALLVGLFLIYNSVSFSVVQRRPLIGVLRALGLTRRQVLALILGEAFLIGLLACGIGVVVGIWLGDHLLALVARSINDLYFRVSVTDVSVEGFSITKGVVAGLAAAIAAASVPALEAASFQPRLAMTRSTLEHRARRLLPLLVAVGIMLIVAAALTLLLSARSLVAGLIAVLLMILGFALCIPPFVRASTSWMDTMMGGLSSWVRHAISDIGASLSRTGVAIVSLAVAVSATIGVSVMVDSFRLSVSDWLEQTLQADIYVRAESGSLDEDLVTDISAAPGIEAVSTSRRIWFEDENSRTQVLAIRMAPGSYAGTEILGTDVEDVWPVFESDDVVLVSEPFAYRNEVGTGDIISLPGESTSIPFDIAAIYRSYDINASAVLMSRATYDRHFDDDNVDSLGLYLSDTAIATSTINRLEAMSQGRQSLEINSNVRIRELSLEIFDQTFVITDVLYLLAIGVAIIGILGSMLALQLERARDLAIFRALGMTPLQVGGMITLQTGVIGLLSGLAAIPLGLVMAWVLIEVINRRAFGWHIDMTVTPGMLLSAVSFAIAAAIIGGLYPAWRAARSQPALAMREE
jgi:putative ABC transport system permease protein